MTALQERLEHGQRAPSRRIELCRAGAEIALYRVAQDRQPLLAAAIDPLRIIAPLCDHLLEYRRILAHIQRRQVKAEGVDAAHEARHEIEPRVQTFVGPETLHDEHHVSTELAQVL